MNGHEMPIRQLTFEEIKLLADFHQKPGLALTSTSGLQAQVTNSREVILGMLSMCTELLARQAQDAAIGDSQWFMDSRADIQRLTDVLNSKSLAACDYDTIKHARDSLMICVNHIETGFKGDTAQ